ncbi:MAG: type 1 pili tip component [Gammaproteobacteria bacterium]
MNRVKQLLAEWSQSGQVRPLVKTLSIEVSATDYARARALAELYNHRSEQQIMSELFSAMLDEVEEALPYLPGKMVVAEDEFGDPVFEDIGLSRKFEQLVHKYGKANT